MFRGLTPRAFSPAMTSASEVPPGTSARPVPPSSSIPAVVRGTTTLRPLAKGLGCTTSGSSCTLSVSPPCETATRLIGFTVQLLAQHPDERARLVADPSLVPNAIEEVLRLESPSPVQARYVQRDVEVHGTVVPEGSVMLLLNAAANRDERHWTDPDRFDVHRDEGAHLAFGFGLHFCLGAALARLEGRVVLEEILRRWSAWDVDIDRGRMAHTASVRGWGSLPVRPQRGS